MIPRKMRISPPTKRQRWHSKMQRSQSIVLAQPLINSLPGMERHKIRPVSTRISPCCRERFITLMHIKAGESAPRFSRPDGPAVRMEYSKIIKAGVNATIQDYELQAIMAANTPPGTTWKEIMYNNPDSPNKGLSKILEGYFAG